MKLSTKRQLFTIKATILVQYAIALGYRPAYDDVMRHSTCSHGHKKSTHRSGVALDLILYNEDGTVYDGVEWFNILHNFWDTLGGSKRIQGDLGHFSLEHNGVR